LPFYLIKQKSRFNEEKTLENLIKFAMSYANGNVYELSRLDLYRKELAKNSQKPWLISYCLQSSGESDNLASSERADDSELNYELNCLDELVQRKLAIMLHGLVRVGSLNCQKKEARQHLCSRLRPKNAHPLMFYSTLPNITLDTGDASFTQQVGSQASSVIASDYKQIVKFVLSLLPDVKNLEENEFEVNFFFF
jgi:hypothetical protein